MSTDMSTGKTMLVLAIVLGCFAVLWPKIFAPMMFQNTEKTIKPDRIPRPGPEFGHPALRSGGGRPIFPGEEGRTLRRTIDKELKPGPVPGMRPSMGGPGPGMQPQSQRSQTGPMGILMPLYTIGIVVFFVYTVLKIMFKKKDDSDEYETHQATTSSSSKLSQQYGHLDPTAAMAAADDSLQQFAKMQQQLRAQPFRDVAPVSASSTNTKQAIPKKEPVKKILTVEEDDQEKITEPQQHEDSEKCHEEKSSLEVKAPMDSRDEEIFLLKKRLEETERAMKLIFEQMAKASPPSSTATTQSVKEEISTADSSKTDDVTNEEENSSTESVDLDSSSCAKNEDDEENEDLEEESEKSATKGLVEDLSASLVTS